MTTMGGPMRGPDADESQGVSAPRLVAPKDSPDPGRAPRLDWGPVPAAARELAVGRLRAMTLVMVGLTIAFAMLTSLAARPAYEEQALHTYASRFLLVLPPTLASLTIFVSLAFRSFAGRAEDKQRVLDIGVLYQVFLAGVLAFLHHLHTWRGFWIYTGWSHVALLTIFFAVVIPATPGRVLAASIATALMDPFMLLLTVAIGAPWPARSVTAMLLVPDAFAVAFAYVAASIVHQLGKKLDRAQGMGSYRLVERLGVGGMGEVWRAEHQTLARAAAIKLIRADAIGGGTGAPGDAARRFEREAQATALLTSPHTITVYDFGQSNDGSFYYVMELLDGVDLEQCVSRHGPMPPERVVHVLRQVCHSLAEAHSRGLVHRDVKPANVYLCRQGLDHDVVKVLDFGLVKPTTPGPLADAKLTQRGEIQGTPAYLAPEQILGTDAVDGRVDIYALGCVAYWLLAGSTVFSASTVMGQLFAHKGETPEPLSKRVAVPPLLDAIVLRCLEKKPEARFADAGALDAALAQVPLGAEWTKERARAWWEEREASGPTGAADASLDETVRAPALEETAKA